MDQHKKPNGRRLASYITGFVFSVILTLVAYYAVTQHAFSRNILIMYIIGLALIQFAVQLLYFLHLGEETRPRFKLLLFGFMLSVVLILVGGSLWIMNSMNYRMLPDEQHVKQYMNSQDGL
ncbi:MAG TPA: cytochrome o ubiquinol oxidase subunit IV [Candidatus Saccharimonadales bacterium]|nr:cytochrome o ubiquinol oxidase subunit IV [Candidatus Saccharimonadales bacterium]